MEQVNMILPTGWLGATLGIGLAAGASVLARKMDISGALTGIAIALGMYLGGGYPHLGLLVIFFVLGVGASSFRKKQKQAIGLAQENGGKRSVRHAFANGGIAGITGLLVWLWPSDQVIGGLVMAGCMASALGDTWSSELGNMYGRRYLDLRTGKQGQRGMDGVISLEGTLIGFVGSGVVAGYYVWVSGQWKAGLLVLVAGWLGNLADSIFGASLQRQGWLNNDQVNFLSTGVAAACVILGANLVGL